MGEANPIVYASDGKRCPHWEQNLAVADTSLPQSAQARSNGAAHCLQNLAPEAFWCWHFGQFIVALGESSEPT